jgi:hypothetical protein
MKGVCIGYAGPNHRIKGEHGKVYVSHDVLCHEHPLPKQIDRKAVDDVPLISCQSSDSESTKDAPD